LIPFRTCHFLIPHSLHLRSSATYFPPARVFPAFQIPPFFAVSRPNISDPSRIYTFVSFALRKLFSKYWPGFSRILRYSYWTENRAGKSNRDKAFSQIVPREYS
jgi:hypothetical protein